MRRNGDAGPERGVGDSYLEGEAARSACDAWAVGYYSKDNVRRTLALDWNGKAWRVKPTVNLGGSANDNRFLGRGGDLRDERLGGGLLRQRHRRPTLIERWNGKAWNG